MHRVDLFENGAYIETDDIPGLENEAGGHRIQRVPPTERRGRVHTSTVTVSVLRSDTVENVPSGFSVRWFSGTGKGGQHRNKHQNCCEITHTETGLKKIGASSRSRVGNYRTALTSLENAIRSRASSDTSRNANAIRKAQIGSGMRGDKRRTYRFQDDTVSDHVTGKKARASEIMKGSFDRLW